MELILGNHAGVFEIRFNRPKQLNALTQSMASALLEAIEQALADPQVNVILITAEGTSFCAGKDRDAPPSETFVDTLQLIAARLVLSVKPVLAAVQGWAVGAGFEILVNCDLTIGAKNAKFKMPEVELGLFSTGGMAVLLPRLIGTQRAKGMLMTGRTLPAAEALAWGLIWDLVDDDDPAPHARELAKKMAAFKPAALGGIKSLVAQGNFPDFEAGLDQERNIHRLLSS